MMVLPCHKTTGGLYSAILVLSFALDPVPPAMTTLSRPPLLSLLLVVAAAGGFPITSPADEPVPAELEYRVVRRIPLKGETGWDYLAVDGKARRIYVTRSTRVDVLDADSGDLVGEIAGTEGVHGVALAPALGRGFTSNGRSDSVTIFDLKTLAVIGTVKTGANPDAIIFEPTTKRVFVFNGRGKNATVFEAESGKVAGEIPVGGKPEFAAVDGAGTVFVNVEDTNELLPINAKTLAVKGRWPLGPGIDPTGLAINAKSHRLFAGCGNKLLVVLDFDTGRVVTTLAVGAGVDAVETDPNTGGIFTSNGVDGTLTVARMEAPDKFSVLDTVVTQKGGRTMAYDPETRHIFIVAAQYAPPVSPTPEAPRPSRTIVPGSVVLLELAPVAEVR